MLPIVTVIGLQVGFLLAGAVLTETVFAWPGIGTWLVDAIEQPQLPGPAGRDPLRRARLRARQPDRRHLVRIPEPEDPALVSLAEIESREIQLEAPQGLWRDAWLRLRHNNGALVGFALVGDLHLRGVLRAAGSPPTARVRRTCRSFATAAAPGRRWITGSASTSSAATSSRASSTAPATRSLIGVVSVAVGLSIGLVLGAIAGYFGGCVDSMIMRLMDIMLAIPGLLLAIGIVAMLGPGIFQIMIAVGVVNIPMFARLLRGAVLAQRENDFVLAARAVGVPGRAILGSHILPNAISPVIVQGDAGARDRDHRRRRPRLPRSWPAGPGDAGVGHDADRARSAICRPLPTWRSSRASRS